MTRRKGALDADEFRERLRGNRLVAPLAVTGMVKPIDGDETAFLFTAAECDNWVTIPFSAIENTHVVGSRPCRDHNHPVATIELSRPSSGDTWSFDLLAATMDLMDRWGALAMDAGGGFGGEEFEERKPEATPSCTRCIKRCNRQHPGDFFGFINCTASCPC